MVSPLKKFLLMVGLASIEPLTEISSSLRSWTINSPNDVPFAITEDFVYLAICDEAVPYQRDVQSNLTCLITKDDYAGIASKAERNRRCGLYIHGRKIQLLKPVVLNENRLLFNWIDFDLDSFSEVPDPARRILLMTGIFDLNDCRSLKVTHSEIHLPRLDRDFSRLGEFVRVIPYKIGYDVIFQVPTYPHHIEKLAYDADGFLEIDKTLSMAEVKDEIKDLTADVQVFAISSDTSSHGYYLWSAAKQTAYAFKEDGKLRKAVTATNIFDDPKNQFGAFTNSHNLIGVCYASLFNMVKCIQANEDLQLVQKFYGLILKTGPKALTMYNLGVGKYLLLVKSCNYYDKEECKLELMKIFGDADTGSVTHRQKLDAAHYKTCNGPRDEIHIFEKPNDIVNIVFLCFGKEGDSKQKFYVTTKEVTLVGK